MLNLPLQKDNILREDIDVLIEFLKNSDIFTQNKNVIEFEKQWSEWLSVKHSLFVNSGSSANFITLAVLKELYGAGEVITSPLGWSSDISAIMNAGHTPVFVDVNMDNMSMNDEEIISKINENTKAVLLTHVLGFSAITDNLLNVLREKNIALIEDCCESHGATHNGKKIGSFGLASNFSFYYAHHMSTIEGGMICTNDDEFYQYARMYRSHGMLRECNDLDLREKLQSQSPDTYEEFTFIVPGFNMRSTELNAVIGLNQLKRLDNNCKVRYDNFKYFLSLLDNDKYFTDFAIEGSSNYAFILIVNNNDDDLYKKVIDLLRAENVEFRRGTAGGGNLTRQPFIKKIYPDIDSTSFKNTELIHKYGVYIGNYPLLDLDKIKLLCEKLNAL